MLYFIVITAIKYATPHDWAPQIHQGIALLSFYILTLRGGYLALPNICDAYDWEWRKTA